MAATQPTIELPSSDALDPDARLMLKVRDDDAAAFEELVLRYQNRLLAVLGRLAPSRELAEDLTQEVFMRVYRARKSYQPQAKFSTWLFTIANNVASNARRKKSRQKEYGVSGNAAESGAVSLEQMAKEASGLMPSRAMARVEKAEVVRMAIDALSERQRMALLLSKFEHMGYAEIAETMELTESAVKSLLMRARVNLKTLLAPYMSEGEA